MRSKPTLADLRHRLMEIQADVDETIRAIDAVGPQRAAATTPTPRQAGRRRPVREVVLEYLEDLGWPANARELAMYASARYGRELPSVRFGSLGADERTAFAKGAVRPVWLCHALSHERGDVVRRQWARSDWPLERRIVAPTTARVQHLKLTARLCEIAAESETEPGKLHQLVADYAEDLPDVRVRPNRFDLDAWRDAALAELGHVEPADHELRVEAAARLGRHLSEAQQLFGASDALDRPRTSSRAPASGVAGRLESVTMRDVGRAAGVSQSTVSRVLTPSITGLQIKEETRRRVLAKITELGYHPNQYARSLRGKKSHMLGMMVADITNPFYHPLVRGVQDVAVQHRYDVMIANTDHTHEKEQLFIDSIVRRPVDGVIVVPYYLSADELDNLIVRTGVAVASVGKHIDHPRIDVSYADDARASHELVAWLIQERGHSRIAMVCADLRFPVTVGRVDAYRRALTDAHLPVAPEYIVSGDWSFATGQRAMRELMALPSPPTAVFAASDTIAIGALEEAESMHLRVPEDVAIVGFDDIPEAQWVRPRLTTVAQDPSEMGRQLAVALFERIESNPLRERQVFVVPCRFIERETA
jgi:LacI family repressor for deo operon, udp, cdd, tsx, nupC, and nupG